MTKEFTSVITLNIGGNNFEAQNQEDYIQKLKASFLENFNIELNDSEINEIEEAK